METAKIFVIIFYFICLYIFLHTYYYLVQIDNCPCFHKDGKYEVNIDFMKFFQILEIIILSIYVSSIFFFKSNTFKMKNVPMPTIILSLTIFLMLGISIYMTINVFNLYINIKEDCKCVDSWYRFFIYYEGIVSLIAVFRIVVLSLILLMVFLFSKF